MQAIGRPRSPEGGARAPLIGRVVSVGLIAMTLVAYGGAGPADGGATWSVSGLLARASGGTAYASVPPADAGSDGSCETRPTTYPADGEPVPETAKCALVQDASQAAVGEVWTWADADSVQWYNYAAASVGNLVDSGSVVMCGSTDAGESGTDYVCSPDSTYLLFTVAGLFVEWPTTQVGDLYFCQLTTFGAGAEAVTGNACATVSSAAEDPPGDGGIAELPSTPTPTPSEPPAAPDPSPSPTTSTAPTPGGPTAAPTAPVIDQTTPATAGQTEGSLPPPAASPTIAGSSSATAPVVSTEGTPTAAPSTSPSVARPTAVPLEYESVARVGGSRISTGFVLALAAALALGGYLMLAGPGLIAARRRRQ